MQAIKHIITGVILLVTASCIEPYQPKIKEGQSLLVINGKITDRPGIHTVHVSRSSPFDDPDYAPVSGCVVYVEDENGQGVTYSDDGAGEYSAFLTEDFLGTDKAYKLTVLTPDGKEYQSEYDSLLPCPELKDLYYEVLKQETEDRNKTIHGIQFFVDVKGNENESRNMLWELEETWEYISGYGIQYIWDGFNLVEFSPTSYARYTCFMTLDINKIHTASTRFLAENELTKYPLNFISNQSNRLRIKYSLLARQHSLSQNAFLYWDKLENQLSGQGGLYETQPAGSEGNMYNVNNPYETVLGFFYASQVKEKRIMVDETFKFRIYDPLICKLDTAQDIRELPATLTYMISLNVMGGTGPPYGYSSLQCHDCELRGGTTTRPPYWDNYE